MRLSMVPAALDLFRRHCDTYGGAFCFSGGCGLGDIHHFDDIKKQEKRSSSLSSLSKTSSMADEPSRTLTCTSDASAGDEGNDDEVGITGNSSKNWLQLGLTMASSTTPAPPTMTDPAGSRGVMLELELFCDRPIPSHLPSKTLAAAVRPDIPSISSSSMAMVPPLMLPSVTAPAAYGLGHYRLEMQMPSGGWNPNLMIGSSSSAVPPLPPALPEYMARQFMCAPGSSLASTSSASAAAGDVTGSMRVINPPRRQQSGIWFLLQAAEKQSKEPFLPQIPKSYLRIKDGRMTVRLLIKYLTNKLGLEDESEVEMTCRGHLLLPFLTLEHVRDNIWCMREQTTSMALFLDESPVAAARDHIMTLQYSRRSA